MPNSGGKAGSASIFFGLSSFQALAMFRRGIFYTFLAIYLRSYLGLSVTETTLFETIPMILNVLFQTFVWGNLTDRLQRRRSLIIVGELCAGLGHILLWYAHILAPTHRSAGYVIIAGLSVIEIFWSMSNIGWSAYISDVYKVEERNSIQGKFSSIGGVGRIIGAILGGLLYDGMTRMYPGWGFREGSIFFVSAFVMIVSVIPLLYLPEGGMAYQAGSNADGEDPTPASEAHHGKLRVFVVFLVSMLLINSGVNTLGAFRGQYLVLKEGFSASANIISLVVNVESAALIVSGLFLGLLGRRLGLQRLLIAGTLSGIASIVMHMLAPTMGFIYLGAAFKGISDACVASSSYALASTLIPPERRGRYFAFYNATFFLSWGLAATLITGPLIDYLLARGTGPVLAYKAGLASGAALMALGLVVLLILLASRKRRTVTPTA